MTCLNSDIINATETGERNYLDEVKAKLDFAVEKLIETALEISSSSKQINQHFLESKAEMDTIERAFTRQVAAQTAISGENAIAKRKKLLKLKASPYFGRIDFVENGRDERTAFYIGLHPFFDEQVKKNVIYDWRAPVSSMFYDFEAGIAWFDTPSRKVSGKLLLKRQYRISNGNMEFMFDSALHIQDDILQQELGRSSNDKMKHIVSTIQYDQNAIIRNHSSTVLIIQGVAGSGKTSIALHRIAFLLYKFKDTLTSDNILIISPNKVFADYISNVLPELGEEKIPEVSIEQLASQILGNRYKFNNFYQEVSFLLAEDDEHYAGRIHFKSTFDFIKKINQYIAFTENNYFKPTSLKIGSIVIPAHFILERFKVHSRIPLLKRFTKIIKDIQEKLRLSHNYVLNKDEKIFVKDVVYKMFRFVKVFDLYKDFYDWLQNPELFSISPKSVLDWSDVFPLIYFKIRLEGIPAYNDVKHLVVDEMQDYSPIQYAVLSRLFNCKKTILGDANQSVNPFTSSSADEIKNVFPHADVVKICKSYRSTLEISEFTKRILYNPDHIAIERHGEEPKVICFSDDGEQSREICSILDNFRKSNYKTLGVLCKTQQQAQVLDADIKLKFDTCLLTNKSVSFSRGIIITSAHMAKGLEFDEVIVPFASADNYKSKIDKSMLYVACTRAMHKLTVTYVKEISPFLI